MSKFFWHQLNTYADCGDVEKATTVISPFEKPNPPAAGWMHRMSLLYLTALCGEDCLNRYHLGASGLEQIEQQAANNLRRSFAVVGLLNETTTFYNMIDARINYVNMSLNPKIKGNRHSSKGGDDAERCRSLYQDPSFQQKLRSKSPAVAALDRLYHLAVQVNRHQLRELEQCASFPVSIK